MKKRVRILAITLAVLMAATVTVYAAYDSTTDPLISKSYLEQIFKSQIDAEIEALRGTVETQETTIAELTQKITDLLAANETQASDMAKFAKQYEDLLKLVNAQDEKIKTLEKNVGAQDKTIGELSTKVGTLETTIKAAQELMNTFVTRISEVETKLSALSTTSEKQSGDIKILQTQLSDLNSAVSTLRTAVTLLSQSSGSTTSDTAEIKVIHLEKGQKLICNGGSDVSTEIYLRAGEAIAVSQYDSDGAFAQGLADLTHGKELFKGDALDVNAYIIVPRGDGRGVQVTSDEAYFLVRGPYTIVKK